MRTTTCQPGGPRDLEHRGQSHDVINAQDRHLEDAVEDGDAAHQEARAAMRGRWRHPRRSTGWYRDVRATFDGLRDA